MNDQNPTEVRDTVSRAYTEAIERAERGEGDGCCSSGCCGPAGVAAQTAGYGAEVDGIPAEAAAASFGCGNPLAYAEVQPGQTVLDLGSGAGLDLLIAAAKVGPAGRVLGVDMTEAMLAAARRNIARAGAANVEVRQGLIEDLPVEDGSVDWVISNCVINLSPDKPRVFREIHRVLRPGGRFSISDIVARDLPETIRRHAAAHSACIAGALSEEEYVTGLRAAGLEDVTVGERLVYDASQLRSLVESDLRDVGEEDEELLAACEAVAGRVWSARVSGRKAA